MACLRFKILDVGGAAGTHVYYIDGVAAMLTIANFTGGNIEGLDQKAFQVGQPLVFPTIQGADGTLVRYAQELRINVPKANDIIGNLLVIYYDDQRNP